MKIKFSIVIFFVLISFFNIGAVSSIPVKQSSFGEIESVVANESNFVENGVKLQYKSRNNITNEVDRIKDYLNKSINGSIKQLKDNEFEFTNCNLNIKVKLWNDSKYTYEEITLINNNNIYTTKQLTDMINGLVNKAMARDVEEFLYYKGEILNGDKSIEDILSQKANVTKENVLDINNGCTGYGYLNDGEKLNFAISKYDTGSYVIIGTPIIFATY